MVINENNSHINTFAQGMNSDTAYDIVGNSLYVYGKNIRITKNIRLGEGIDNPNYSSSHEGVIAPVLEGKIFNRVHPWYINNPTILAAKSINNIGIIIAKHLSNNVLCVYRFEIDNEDNITYSNYENNLWYPWWKIEISADKEAFESVKQVSAVLYQELENVIKLYIATGVYPIIEIRVDGNVVYDYTTNQDVDDFVNNRILPQYPVYIENKIAGLLKTSQIQYTYRYYNKFGITTQLAPLTNKILVIDSNRNKEVGNAQDTITSVGFTLKIRNVLDYKNYERIQIYRVLYIKPGEDAKVALIYDGEVKTDGNDFLFNDVGITSLAELTIEEFAAMSGLIIIPKVIELNQQYLFASNIQDDTIIQGLTTSGGMVRTTNDILVTLSTNLTQEPSIDNNEKYTSNAAKNYFEDRSINIDSVRTSYNDIFTSSLLRSLRRGEDYYYAIVYYDKYGRRTNAIPIATSTSSRSINIPESQYTTISGLKLITEPIGVRITLPQPKIDGKTAKDIIGCLIIRRSSKEIYQNTLLQVAMTMPIRQTLYTTEYDDDGSITKETPLYPTGFLFSGRVSYTDLWYWWDREKTSDALDMPSTKMDQYAATPSDATRGNIPGIWQIFSNEIDFARDDVMSRLQSELISANVKYAYYFDVTKTGISNKMNEHLAVYNTVLRCGEVYAGIAFPIGALQDPSSKSSEYMLFPFYHNSARPISSDTIRRWPNSLISEIESIKDVKIPEWLDGFSNIQIDGTHLAAGGIKKYKQFVTNIGGYEYNNWCSSGNYDMRITLHDAQANLNESVSLFVDTKEAKSWDYVWRILNQRVATVNSNGEITNNYPSEKVHPCRHARSLRHIGPGPSCFLILTKERNPIESTFDPNVYICNIKHDISNVVSSEPDEFIQYFGFGNWFNLKFIESQNGEDYYSVVHNYKDSNGLNVENLEMIVYDGDIYVTPHEIVTMFKTYDFNSIDTLPSMQVVNYVPMESKVNTYFDYGMNFLNTHSTNLLIEPGSIDGITAQDRPLHQYNQIYSANDESNDVFTLVREENDNNFKQRTYYSEPKTNGEYVDNFVVFKAAAFIDVDGKHGEITNLLTNKNTLYYWQDRAFGKFSVNERSLINDQNGNTIMLGQAGILSRNDYISTKYGMRMYDFCATDTENGISWVDIENTAVVSSNGSDCINLGEQLNVLNIINSKLSKEIPKVDYDLQNNELLCKCLVSSEEDRLDQIVFNLKLGVATSIYTRDYDNIVTINNSIYGFKIFKDVDRQDDIQFTKYNNIRGDESNSFLSPMLFSFLVNASASTTKVFDSQQLVPAKRKEWDKVNDQKAYEPNLRAYTSFFEDAEITNTFETDINYTDNTVQPYTDREGNITYNIPRFEKDSYGNRLRGKWMKVGFDINNPTEYTTISHIITKFRQSYS